MPAAVITSYLAIGDSFTEGTGDAYSDGSERGWADLVAFALAAAASPAEFRYANLAIRGRKLAGILAEQFRPAVAQRPDLISINGGGNDMLRPTMKLADADTAIRDAVLRARDAVGHVLLLSGGDPTEHLPMGRVAQRRGLELQAMVEVWARVEEGVTVCDNFSDTRLRSPEHWAPDGLHLNTRGHARVAQNVLRALGAPEPPELAVLAEHVAPVVDYRSRAYYREHVLPWVGRRLRGRSSGDGRLPKRAELAPLAFDPDRPFER
ncbi:MAG: SGNH/GDSL hydrolase family protein [Actinomycetales bacterium]|nr:SGNH/GDSL hydrolase family protein [Actinomycetales bacterium]